MTNADFLREVAEEFPGKGSQTAKRLRGLEKERGKKKKSPAQIERERAFREKWETGA